MAKVIDTQTSDILNSEVVYCEPSPGEMVEENYFYVRIDSCDTCTPKQLIELGTFLINEALLKLK